jgi:hypothetical protein
MKLLRMMAKSASGLLTFDCVTTTARADAYCRTDVISSGSPEPAVEPPARLRPLLTSRPCRVIHNADAHLLDRYVQSSKMVHAALLLLMLEAVTTDFV